MPCLAGIQGNRGEKQMTRMTWERFELTGAVEDYLRYKGIDWREEGQARAVCAEQGTERRNTENGTDDHSDGNGAGGLSLR